MYLQSKVNHNRRLQPTKLFNLSFLSHTLTVMTMNQRNFCVHRIIAMAFRTPKWTTVVSKLTLMLTSAVQQRPSVVRTVRRKNVTIFLNIFSLSTAEERKKLATCWDNSVAHREGEKFISASNPCYECRCHKDFDNTTITGNAHCRKLNCDIELKYKTFIQRGCLPIFEDDKCCPIDWKCRECVHDEIDLKSFYF